MLYYFIILSVGLQNTKRYGFCTHALVDEISNRFFKKSIF